jgi:catechol 2,3-dioxygenase-like lactoylglutathione lyase family enzyme
MRVKMCSIHVIDPAQAFAFYTRTLGFQELLVIADATRCLRAGRNTTGGTASPASVRRIARPGAAPTTTGDATSGGMPTTTGGATSDATTSDGSGADLD